MVESHSSTLPVEQHLVPSQRSRLLVVVSDERAGGEPQVFLADSEQQTEDERLFLCAEDVVRLPRSASVAVRPVHHEALPPIQGAEEALLKAVVGARSRLRGSSWTGPVDGPSCAVTAAEAELSDQLSAALERGDGRSAGAWAGLLEQAVGLPTVYETLRRTLAELGEAWAHGSATVLRERVATAAATTVVELLRAGTAHPDSSAGTVVLAAPAGDRHALGLLVLAHLLEQAGHRTLVVGDLPLDELLALVARPDTIAVVLSAHNPVDTLGLRTLVESLRRAAPTTKVVVGGPGLPTGTTFARMCGADLVSSDPVQLLALLCPGESCPLTPREREVLRAVADGLTNAEVAGRLCVAPATVKSHLDSVLSKTGTEHRAAAVARALRAGWIS